MRLTNVHSTLIGRVWHSLGSSVNSPSLECPVDFKATGYARYFINPYVLGDSLMPCQTTCLIGRGQNKGYWPLDY